MGLSFKSLIRLSSAHLGPIRTPITGYVTDDLRQVRCVFHDEHMAEHFEVGKVGRERLDLRPHARASEGGRRWKNEKTELTFNEEMKVW